MITTPKTHQEQVDKAREQGERDYKERHTYAPADLECRCIQCRLAYIEGQDKAVAEMVTPGRS